MDSDTYTQSDETVYSTHFSGMSMTQRQELETVGL